MANGMGRSWRAAPVVIAALGVLTGLSACSGAGAGAETAANAAAQSAASTGPCEKAQFAAHSGLAAGAIQSLVWQPAQTGAFKAHARDRAAAIAKAHQASALAARELEAAASLVAGCPGGTRLINALATGRSLASSASKQLAAKSVNQLTLAGANSITTTVVQEAKAIGIDVKPMKPTPAQLRTAATS